MDSGQKNRPTGLAEDRQEQLERVIGKMITVDARESDPSREAELATLRQSLVKSRGSRKGNDELSIAVPVSGSLIAGLWLTWKIVSGEDLFAASVAPYLFCSWIWSFYFAYNSQVKDLPFLRHKLAQSRFAARVLDRELAPLPIDSNWLERLFKHQPHSLPPYGSESWLKKLAADYSRELTGTLALRRRLLLPMLLALLTPFLYLYLVLTIDALAGFSILSLPLVCFGIASGIGGYRLALAKVEQGLLDEVLADELGIVFENAQGGQLSLVERLRQAVSPPHPGDLRTMNGFAVVLGILLMLLLGSWEKYALAGLYAISALPAYLWARSASLHLEKIFVEALTRFDPLRHLADSGQSGSLAKRARELLLRRQRLIPELRRRPLRREWIYGAAGCAAVPLVIRLFGSTLVESYPLAFLSLACIGPWLLALLSNEVAASFHQRHLLSQAILLPLEAQDLPIEQPPPPSA